MLAEKIQLEENETVLKQVRKHWFILFMELFGVCMLALLPLIIYWAVGFLGGNLDFTIDFSNYSLFLIYGYAAWLLVVWMIGFHVWTDYYLDVWIVTNRRIVIIDQKGLFNRETGSFRLERLQDVNVEINGIIATFLDFGMVEVETAGGNQEDFRTHGLPHPRELKALILNAADQLIPQYGQKKEQPRDLSGVT